MLRSKIPLTALSLCLASSVNAGLIVHEYRSISSGGDINSNNYIASWDSLDSTIFSQDLDQFTNQRSGNRRMNHLSVDLSFDNGFTDFSFEAGLDAGFGAAVFLNGNQIAKDTTDVWWAYNWTHNDVFRVNDLSLTAGNNSLDFYWGEWCCNGGSSIRFSMNNSEWMDLSVANIESSTQAIPVPEPALIPLIAVGAAGLLLIRLRSGSNPTNS